MTIKQIKASNGVVHEIEASYAVAAGEAQHAEGASYADEAGTTTSATEATYAMHAEKAGALNPAATVQLTGAVTGSATSGNGWSVNTSLAANSVTGTHIANSTIGLDKLASEIGVVVVQSAEPSSSSAAKIWVKI